MFNDGMTIKTIAHLLTSINHYIQIQNYFDSIHVDYNGKIKEHLNSVGYYDLDFNMRHHNWTQYDIHIINQSWSSTSKGWGGVGGAAMSAGYNMIIENNYLNLFFVYWDGKLAFAAKIQEDINYSRLPSLNKVEDKLDVLFVNR